MYTPNIIIRMAAFSLTLAGCSAHEEISSNPQMAESNSDTAITESEISVGDLRGSMILAQRSAPIVLIVPGSGPTDRDGNSPQGIKAQPYKLLAEALEQKGISTVRVDKRGMFGSQQAGDPNAVTVDKYARDYRNWIKSIRTQTNSQCIWLLGHSEGGLMVMAASVDQTDVCGLILVSAVGRIFGQVLREQLKSNPANAIILDDAFRIIGELEAGNLSDVSESHPALQQLFSPVVQNFLISIMAIDPSSLGNKVKLPTLVLQGNNDIQVSEKDAQILAAATDGKLVILDGINHVLKNAPTDRAGNLATYFDPDLPVDSKLVDAIAEFVISQN